MKEVSDKIKKSDKDIDRLKSEINKSLLYLPNVIHESVPVGKTEKDIVVVREYGEKLVFDLIGEIKKNAKVELIETQVANEKVSFKLPKDLIN